MKKQIPNLFTLLNLFFGCLAIVAILRNGILVRQSLEGNYIVDLPQQIVMASVFIGLAALIDFLDGFVARLFNATSELGKQLDSLADVVSFGVAPSLILFQFLYLSYAGDENGINCSQWVLCPSFILAMAAAYRLAKFNTNDAGFSYFKGIPTPAVGLLVASFPLAYWFSENTITFYLLTNKWFLYALIASLSFLMVSNLPMMSLKIKNLKFNDNIQLYLLLLISVPLIILFSWASVALIFVSYIILSLIFRNKIIH
jgi:CDP-diacylglycerol--serine O-phosphatidyltransferase